MLSISCLCSLYKLSSLDQFKRSFSSVFCQLQSSDQIVIVIDGEISHELDDYLSCISESASVVIVRIPQNVGLGPALNVGLSHCDSDIICRFDTDDICLDHRLSLVRKHFEDPALSILATPILEFTTCDSNLSRFVLKSCPDGHQAILRSLSVRNPINHPSVSFRKKPICDLGGYIDLKFFEDYYLWLKCRALSLKFHTDHTPTVLMRRNGVLGRRSGLQYFMHQLRFASKAFGSHLISPIYLPVYIFRLLLVLLPSSLQTFQNSLPWRQSQPSWTGPNPDKLLFWSLDLFC